MSVLALPMAPAGSVQEQVTQQYAYLVQMAQQLNLALGQLEALGGGAGEASARRQANGRLGTAASETADGQYETQLEAAPEAVTQYYSFFSDLQANVEKVDAAFAHYKLDTEGYIRTGIVYYDGAAPVYGVAVGQDLTCREVDGEKVVEQNNFRAVFTATRLSFWQDATEVAYVSNNRLYITNITVLGGIDVGQWSMEAAEGGLAFRWIGG